MSRTVVALMVRTGIPFSVWLDEPDGVIDTALELLNESGDQTRTARDDTFGRRMSG